jgi:hypothetical protein
VLLRLSGRGRPGRAGELMAGTAVRESVTVAGLAERARVARAFVGAVLVPPPPMQHRRCVQHRPVGDGARVEAR